MKLLSLEPFPSPKATTHFPCRSTTCAAPASAPHFTSAATLRRSSSKGAAAKPSASGVDRGKPQRDPGPDLDDDAGRFKVPTMAANGRKLEKNIPDFLAYESDQTYPDCQDSIIWYIWSSEVWWECRKMSEYFFNLSSYFFEAKLS